MPRWLPLVASREESATSGLGLAPSIPPLGLSPRFPALLGLARLVVRTGSTPPVRTSRGIPSPMLAPRRGRGFLPSRPRGVERLVESREIVAIAFAVEPRRRALVT
jgi:hypothetical protein